MYLLLPIAFISGLATILAPCIWPLLPVVLSSTVQGHKKKPFGIVLGLIFSFTLATLTLSYLLKIFSFDPEILRLISVIVIAFLGFTLLIPRFTKYVELGISRLANRAGVKIVRSEGGFWSGVVTGISLGIVWSPCAGPILAAVATLAATQQVDYFVFLITFSYAVGVGVPLFIFATVGTALFKKLQGVGKYTMPIQQAFGILMILSALAIYTGYDRELQFKLLERFPSYSNLLYKLENTEIVEMQIDDLVNPDKTDTKLQESSKANMNDKTVRAPEFTGINNWLNIDSPLTLKEDLKGKVVLIDFWTYTCINCIRTLPHVTSWYEKYKDEGFVVVGVHTPEFEFEKKTQNVENAIQQYDITYPVAQDNDYKTWRAYANRYWPAHYLIDAEGYVRYTHFGEGKYDETEKKIKELLSEAGNSPDASLVQLEDQTPKSMQTPETYLGLSRIAKFGSTQLPVEGENQYKYPSVLQKDYWALQGTWKLDDEFSETVANSKLKLNFTGQKVFLVIRPSTTYQQVSVSLNGQALTNDTAGSDVKESKITLDTDRLYEIVNSESGVITGELEFDFKDSGIQVFAFTFGS